MKLIKLLNKTKSRPGGLLFVLDPLGQRVSSGPNHESEGQEVHARDLHCPSGHLLDMVGPRTPAEADGQDPSD